MIVKGTTTRSPLLELAPRFGPDLDDLPHHLVSHDVAGQHRRDEVVEQMQVRAADGATGYLDDGIARLLDLRVSDGVAADVFLAVPNQGSHAFLLHPAKVQRPELPGMLRTEGMSLRGGSSDLEHSNVSEPDHVPRDGSSGNLRARTLHLHRLTAAAPARQLMWQSAPRQAQSWHQAAA